MEVSDCFDLVPQGVEPEEKFEVSFGGASVLRAGRAFVAKLAEFRAEEPRRPDAFRHAEKCLRRIASFGLQKTSEEFFVGLLRIEATGPGFGGRLVDPRKEALRIDRGAGLVYDLPLDPLGLRIPPAPDPIEAVFEAEREAEFRPFSELPGRSRARKSLIFREDSDRAENRLRVLRREDRAPRLEAHLKLLHAPEAPNRKPFQKHGAYSPSSSKYWMR